MPFPPVSNITNAELAALLQVIGAQMEAEGKSLAEVMLGLTREPIAAQLFYKHKTEPARARELASIGYDQLVRLMTLPPEDSQLAPLIGLPPVDVAANDPNAPKGGQ